MAKLSSEESKKELVKYRDLILATLSYLRNKSSNILSESYEEKLREQTLEHFEKGRLIKLKQWFRDLSEWPREAGDVAFDDFLRGQTGYWINNVVDFEIRIKAIIARKEIKNETEYREVLSKVDQLCQADKCDADEVAKLNALLLNFEND